MVYGDILMRLLTKRIWPSLIATIGALYIDGASQCFTLEPGSAQGKGPIPAGEYEVKLLPSPHFEASTDPWVLQYAAKMPHIMDIPGFDCVMFHWGDFPKDTHGCPMLGNARLSASAIGDSRSAFKIFYTKITAAMGRGDSVRARFEDEELPIQRMVVTDPELGL